MPEATERILRDIRAEQRAQRTRFNGLETRFTAFEARLSGLEARFGAIEARIGAIETHPETNAERLKAVLAAVERQRP